MSDVNMAVDVDSLALPIVVFTVNDPANRQGALSAGSGFVRSIAEIFSL